MNSFKGYKFKKQKSHLLRIAAELRLALGQIAMADIQAGFVSTIIMEQMEPAGGMSDRIIETCWIDIDLIQYRDSLMKKYDPESTELMDATHQWEQKYLKQAAKRVAKYVVLIVKYEKMCRNLGIVPLHATALGKYSYGVDRSPYESN